MQLSQDQLRSQVHLKIALQKASWYQPLRKDCHMKILFDENNGQNDVKKLLEQKGHDIGQISKSDLKGSPDERVVEFAIEEERIVITRDKDYKKLHDQDNIAPFGLLFVRFYDRGVKIKQYLAERIAWTIDHISKKPES